MDEHEIAAELQELIEYEAAFSDATVRHLEDGDPGIGFLLDYPHGTFRVTVEQVA